MKAATRKRQRALAKSRNRQAFYRENQVEKGLCALQVRLSAYAHNKALTLSVERETSLTNIYALAVKAARMAGELPEPHAVVLDGELIGTKQISPWLEADVADSFEKMAKKYHSRTVAMSAIVNAYCDSQN
ncbi:hypothetical protein [Vibrio marisflavi]|uniref:Uncharacterized protein n=1 Tax=Vibrio marisflavi CECT 7928 TaxID=634439 RepID=A0ABM9A9K0_9VIBR|nr:hypothetical protein [Vibrio marisflavi]CAH0543165.1 hypothetical protein VMF7928_04433 [Vibrio marisflavi CECT 7928]